MTLHLLAQELRAEILGARVDKIYQPSREELVLGLHTPAKNRRLFLSAKGSSPRAHLTELSMENPKEPPMFCMLLRKLLGGARLTGIEQPGFERVLLLRFETTGELGDRGTATLIAELMGHRSNLILAGEDGRVIDAVRRTGAASSPVRQVLPGQPYVYPPAQDRVTIERPGEVVGRLLESAREAELSKLLQQTLDGASPLLCRELVHRAYDGEQPDAAMLAGERALRLRGELEALAGRLARGECVPTAVLTLQGEPKDFSFIPIAQYGGAMLTRAYPSLSALLDAFYGERDAADRFKQRAVDLTRLLSARIGRAERKLAAQREELLDCKNRERLRRAGDLLSANLFALKKGMARAQVPDYYDPEGKDTVIELDPRLTPVQNIQRYYKDYRRADTAERMLKDLIVQGEQELAYLESVGDLLSRAGTGEELSAIRAELAGQGYLRAAPKSRRRDEEKLAPLRYRSSDGFVILSGRNNLQNDRLTLKDSASGDIWFHVQKQAGSHTVVKTEGRPVPDRTLTEAAVIAAFNSKARNSRKVPVDYTAVKNVRKQPGGRPGMVLYERFQTAVVDPDAALAARLSSDR